MFPPSKVTICIMFVFICFVHRCPTIRPSSPVTVRARTSSILKKSASRPNSGASPWRSSQPGQYTYTYQSKNCRRFLNTVEPRFNEVLGTMKITLYQVSLYIRVKKQRNIKSWDQQNYLVIRGFCYIRPLYNEVPLYYG